MYIFVLTDFIDRVAAKCHLSSAERENMHGPKYPKEASWFIATILMLVWDDTFMEKCDLLSSENLSGECMLYRWIQMWRKALEWHSNRSMQEMVDFLRAFVRGHNVPSTYKGGVFAAFELLLCASPSVMMAMRVHVVRSYKCTVCGAQNPNSEDDQEHSEGDDAHSDEEKEMELGCRRVPDQDLQLSTMEAFAALTVQLPHAKVVAERNLLRADVPRVICGRHGCLGEIIAEWIQVRDGQRTSFAVEFHRGDMPYTLYTQALRGEPIQLGRGSEPVEVRAAVFEEDDGLFVCGWLAKSNPRKALIESYKDSERATIVAIWCAKPSSSCFCGAPNDLTVRQCEKCRHFIHRRCCEDTEEREQWEAMTYWIGGTGGGCPYCRQHPRESHNKPRKRKKAKPTSAAGSRSRGRGRRQRGVASQRERNQSQRRAVNSSLSQPLQSQQRRRSARLAGRRTSDAE